MNEADRKIKQELIKTTKAIQKKYEQLHADRLVQDYEIEEKLDPIIKPLREIAYTYNNVPGYKSKNEVDSNRTIKKKESNDEGAQLPEISINKIKNLKETESQLSEGNSPISLPFDNIYDENLSIENRSYSPRKINFNEYMEELAEDEYDKTYGIRKVKGEYKMGNARVNVDNNKGNLTIIGNTHKMTPGIMSLLTHKISSFYTKQDLNFYIKILQKTSAHKRYFKNTESVREPND